MTERPGAAFEPLFLDGPSGRLFAVLHRPGGSVPARGGLVVAAAFGEEMNRCRYMVAEQARRLAANGWCVLIPDLHGTGDSDGELADVSWEGWCRDLGFALDWLSQRCAIAHPGIWAIRLGAGLALEVLRGRPPDGPLVLWQPVCKGATFLTQLLRIRVGSAISMGEPPESTKDLRRRLGAGETLSVGGYGLSPAMAEAIEKVDLRDAAPSPERRVEWLEVVADESQAASPVSLATMESWKQAGIDQARITTAVGPAFWQLHERAVAEALLDATVDRLLDT